MQSIFEDLRKVKSVESEDVEEDGGQEEDEGVSELCRKYSFQLGWMHNKKFLKQLHQDNIDEGLLHREMCMIEKQQKKKTLRGKFLHLLRSNPVQIILCALVLLDALIVVAEIILEMHAERAGKEYLLDHAEQSSEFLRQTFPSHLRNFKNNSAVTDMITTLRQANISCAGSTSSGHTRRKRAAAPGPGDSAYPRGKQEELFTMIAHNLHYTSIAILSIFCIDVIAKMICEGKHYFHEIFEVVDSIIIFFSLAADVAILKFGLNQTSVMIVFLLWRMVRVINGFMVHEKQRDEFRIQMQKRARRMCEVRIEGLQTEKELLEKRVKMLEDLARSEGASEEHIQACKPRYLMHSPKQTNNALKSMAALTGGFMRDLMNAKSRLDISDRQASTGTLAKPTDSPSSGDPKASSSAVSAAPSTSSASSTASSSSSSATPVEPEPAAEADCVALRERPVKDESTEPPAVSYSSGTSRVNSEELSIFATSTEQIVFADSPLEEVDLSKPNVFENQAYVEEKEPFEKKLNRQVSFDADEKFVVEDVEPSPRVSRESSLSRPTKEDTKTKL